MIAHWDGPRGYPWSVVRATLGGHAGLKTRAPSMRIPVIFRTPVIFTLPTQKSEATRDFAKALGSRPRKEWSGRVGADRVKLPRRLCGAGSFG